MLFGDFFKDVIFVDAAKHPAMAKLTEIFHGPVAMAAHGLQTAPFWLAAAGVALSYYMYMVNPALPAAIKRACMPIYTLFENKYYMDWINENILARGARALGVGLWKVGDQAIIDGAVVNGSWKLVRGVSGVVRWLHLPLRAGDDSGCVRTDDLVCLGRCFLAAHQIRKTTNGSVESCNLGSHRLRRAAVGHWPG
jgi:NADH:ubiquinone oxidoreductase subunit 5 (subunit L)/multisubunit Na+/H+ antiporter MnhA subunit